MSSVKITGEMSADQINATAGLVRAYREGDEWMKSWGMWAFFSLLLLLAFRCNDVTLWDLRERHCPKAPLAATEGPSP